MLDDEAEEYVEVPNEELYEEEEEDITLSEYGFMLFIAVLFCVIFAFVVSTIHKYKLKLKVGSVEVGVEETKKE